MSYAISVAAGEGGSGQREVEDEGDDSGIILVEALGLRDKLGLLVGGKVSGIEVWVGLTTGVGISPGEKSGVVVDDFSAAIRLEARSGDCPSWRRRRFPSDVEPLTEREGANGAVSTVEVVASDITASSSE